MFLSAFKNIVTNILVFNTRNTFSFGQSKKMLYFIVVKQRDIKDNIFILKSYRKKIPKRRC